jgi:hypothetical protein
MPFLGLAPWLGGTCFPTPLLLPSCSLRQQEIQEAMAKMPKLIEEYRAVRQLNWEEVSPLDKLTLTQSQIRDKYIKRR